MRQLAWSGAALAAGGALTFLINAGLTPALQSDAPYSVTAASSVFLWRQGLSAVAAMLLLAGSVGLFVRQADRAGRFGVIAFVLTFVGCALLLANEWGQVFFVHGLALTAPDVLEQMEAGPGPNLYDVGALIAFTAFSLGWIMFAASLLRGGVYGRRGPTLVIAGFFAAPALTAVLPGAWGAIVGNAILGSGWMVLGYELIVGASRPRGGE